MEKFPCHVVSGVLVLDASLLEGLTSQCLGQRWVGGCTGGTQQVLRTEQLREWALHKIGTAGA